MLRSFCALLCLGFACAGAPHASERLHRCDRIQVAVTETAYVWLEDDREVVVTLDETVDRLAACRHILARPRVCATNARACAYRITPIWWNATPSDVEAQRRRHARVEALWTAIEQRRLTMPRPNYTLDDDDVVIYRSRRDLGASAELVPQDFDFSRRWIARAYFPNGAWVERCLDDDWGAPRASRAAREAAVQSKRDHLERGRAARRASAGLFYQYGKLWIRVPRAGGERPSTNGPCTVEPEVEAVLVVVPASRVPIAQRHPDQM